MPVPVAEMRRKYELQKGRPEYAAFAARTPVVGVWDDHDFGENDGAASYADKDAAQVLTQGADKISINTPALERPGLIDELVQAFGSQCVVIGIDSIAEGEAYTVRSHTGTPDHMRAPGKKTLDWIAEAEVRGAGEIVLNCMSADGTRSGYDIVQLQAARATTSLPLIASGGAGTPGHFLEAFRVADVDGALAATVFHSGQIAIPELKKYLKAEGIGVRPC